MQQVKSFAILKTARMLGILYFSLGIIVIIPFGMMRLAAGRATFSGLFLLLAPFAYAVGGFLITALLCWIYNVLAKRIGGIEVDLGQS